MAAGMMLKDMGIVSSRQLPAIPTGDSILTANGSGLIAAGRGHQTSPLVGLFTITAVGCRCLVMAGSGCRELSGHQPGCRGAGVTNTLAGHHCRRNLISCRL